MEQKDFQLRVIDSLARLETTMESLAGNGQPGRVGKLEDTVEDLKKARWTIGGAVLGISTAVSTTIHFLFK